MQYQKNIYNYNWKLKDTIFTKNKGKVFSCFASGGGSTMGYKLAGFDVIGMNEIDKKVADIYIRNHNPKYAYIESIRELVKRNDLPQELYNLDILDGSPPCSSFSMVGNREKDWGKEKKFAEGQKKQVLDTLFFDFIELANKLKPKIVIAENVKGILLGNAREYVKKIYKDFDSAGYYLQHYLLDASKMGVPQRRQRVFFFAIRKDLSKELYSNSLHGIPELNMNFNQKPIKYKDIADYKGKRITNDKYDIWKHRILSDNGFCDTRVRIGMSCSWFNRRYIKNDSILYTITSRSGDLVLFDKPIYLSDIEIIKASSFPPDYDFTGKRITWICGMSVPPVMMANIAHKVYRQWLRNI